jgi:glycosyltransferase involved in cell wall biosynthesis
MKHKDLFTIILTNYNQEKYIYEALDSIIIQQNCNIELIISDDHSKIFEKEKILNYINLNHNCISKVKFVINQENIGTVKTLNKALKISSGKYIYIFASDDVLYSKQVIERFVEAFKNNKNLYCISSSCLLCNNTLESNNNLFPNRMSIKSFNLESAFEQNLSLKEGPIFAPGATAYKRELFEKLNYFDEKYVLIEDWSWFLKITRNNYRILILDSISLKHRGGGISEEQNISDYVKNNMLNDTYNIYKYEVFNSLKNVNTENKNKIINRYKVFINMYNKFNVKFYLNYYFLIFKYIDLFIYKIKYYKKIDYCIYLILSLILSNIIYIYNLNIILFCFNFPIIYYLLIASKKITINIVRRFK